MENFIEFIGYDLGVFVQEEEVGTVTYTSGQERPHTGTLVETDLDSVTIPGGLLKVDSVVEILVLGSLVSPASAEATLRAYFGSAKYIEAPIQGAVGAPASGLFHQAIWANNSVSSQKGSNAFNPKFGANQDPIMTSNIDTAEDIIVRFTAQIGDVGDTVKIEGYRIKLNGV